MPKLVLDTNIVLDWLVFNDPSTNALSRLQQATQLVLLTHEPALAEVRRVLNYPALKLDNHRQQSILHCYQSMTTRAQLPSDFSLRNLQLPAGFPVCKDPDDQHFLALAFHTQADALISKDKALLALRKRVAKFGVKICTAMQLPALLEDLHQT